MAQSKCPTCGAAYDGDRGACPTCDTMLRLEMPAPPPGEAGVSPDEILFRYGRGGRHLAHLPRCFFVQMRICTCGLLGDLLELPGSEAKHLHPGLFLELHAQLEVFERLGGGSR